MAETAQREHDIVRMYRCALEWLNAMAPPSNAHHSHTRWAVHNEILALSADLMALLPATFTPRCIWKEDTEASVFRSTCGQAGADTPDTPRCGYCGRTVVVQREAGV